MNKLFTSLLITFLVASAGYCAGLPWDFPHPDSLMTLTTEQTITAPKTFSEPVDFDSVHINRADIDYAYADTSYSQIDTIIYVYADSGVFSGQLKMDKLVFPEATADQVYALLNCPANLAAGDSVSIIFQIDANTFLEITGRGDGSNGIDSLWMRFNDTGGNTILELYSDGSVTEITLPDSVHGTSYIMGNLDNTENPWAYNEGGTGLSTYLQGDLLWASDYNAIGKLNWPGAGQYVVSEADSALGYQTLLKDIVVSGTGMSGGENDCLLGSDSDVTITLATDKDIVVSGTGMSGGENDVLPGSDADVTIALTVNKDIVAGDGLSGGENDVLPGADADVTLAVLLSLIKGLEISNDSVGIKLDAGTLTLSGDGIKVTDNTFQQPSDTTSYDATQAMLTDSLRNITTSVVTRDSLGHHRELSEVADTGEITFSTGVAGWGHALGGDNEAYAYFTFTSAGVVTLVSQNNCTTTNDNDGTLNIYDGGSGIVIENQLGDTKKVALDIKYFTP